MLDTNLLIDFLLIQWKEDIGQRIPPHLLRSHELKRHFVAQHFNHYASEWNKLEFRDVVQKLIEERKLIQHGYGLHEFSEGRKELPLSREELDRINMIVEKTFRGAVPAMSEIDLPLVHSVSERGFSAFDALLLLQAGQTPSCTHFVTRDRYILDNFHSRLSRLLPGLRVLNPKQALFLLSRQRQA